MKKKSIFKVFLVFFIVAFVLVSFIAYSIGDFCYKQMCLRRGVDKEKAEMVSKVSQSNKEYKEEDVILKVKQGYNLSGTYIKNPKETKDTVILVHGLVMTRRTMLSTAKLYLDKGFNVLLYDSRNNGESEGENTTYGYYESYDLDEWVKYVSERNPGGCIGVHGRSMGAATALLHSELNEKEKKVKFYVADCSFSDLKDEFLYVGGRLTAGLPLESIEFCASTVTKLKSGFKFSDVSPRKSVKNASTPILFIHGDKDELVPVSMCKELFNSKTKGLKDMYITPNARHGESFNSDKEEYRKRIYDFIDDVLALAN